MKHIALVTGAGLLALISSPAAAQTSTTGPKATATVNVQKPLQLTALRDLQFGTVLIGAFTGNADRRPSRRRAGPAAPGRA